MINIDSFQKDQMFDALENPAPLPIIEPVTITFEVEHQTRMDELNSAV